MPGDSMIVVLEAQVDGFNKNIRRAKAELFDLNKFVNDFSKKTLGFATATGAGVFAAVTAIRGITDSFNDIGSGQRSSPFAEWDKEIQRAHSTLKDMSGVMQGMKDAAAGIAASFVNWASPDRNAQVGYAGQSDFDRQNAMLTRNVNQQVADTRAKQAEDRRLKSLQEEEQRVKKIADERERGKAALFAEIHASEDALLSDRDQLVNKFIRGGLRREEAEGGADIVMRNREALSIKNSDGDPFGLFKAAEAMADKMYEHANNLAKQAERDWTDFGLEQRGDIIKDEEKRLDALSSAAEKLPDFLVKGSVAGTAMLNKLQHGGSPEMKALQDQLKVERDQLQVQKDLLEEEKRRAKIAPLEL